MAAFSAPCSAPPGTVAMKAEGRPSKFSHGPPSSQIQQFEMQITCRPRRPCCGGVKRAEKLGLSKTLTPELETCCSPGRPFVVPALCGSKPPTYLVLPMGVGPFPPPTTHLLITFSLCASLSKNTTSLHWNMGSKWCDGKGVRNRYHGRVESRFRNQVWHSPGASVR